MVVVKVVEVGQQLHLSKNWFLFTDKRWFLEKGEFKVIFNNFKNFEFLFGFFFFVEINPFFG